MTAAVIQICTVEVIIRHQSGFNIKNRIDDDRSIPDYGRVPDYIHRCIVNGQVFGAGRQGGAC